MLVAEGDPPEVAGLINSDSDLAEFLTSARPIAVSVLGWPHRHVADAFAGMAPSPGGPFRTGEWRPTEWGPVLDGAVAWTGGHLILEPEQPARVGWSLLARIRIEWLELGDHTASNLALLRGSYHSLSH
jgi:hypothetical protein